MHQRPRPPDAPDMLARLDDGHRAEIAFLDHEPPASVRQAIARCRTVDDLRALRPLFEQHQIAYRITRHTIRHERLPHRAKTRAEAQGACEQLGIEYVEEPVKRERRERRPARPAPPRRVVRPARRGRAARPASNTHSRGSRRTTSSSSRSSSSSDDPPSEPPGDDAGHLSDDLIRAEAVV